MINIIPSNEEIEIAKNCGYYNRENSKKQNYINKIFKKPWGQEYLVYQNDNIGIWILHINKYEKTSVHCHFRKASILIPLHGCFKIETYKSFEILHELNVLYFPINTFHGIMSYIDDGVIMEIEIYTNKISYSDKNDLLRLRDIYIRDKNCYENSTQEIILEENEAVNFHKMKQIIYGDTIINFKNFDELYCNSDLNLNNDLNILLNGKIFQENILSPGSIISNNKIISNLDSNTIFLCINNINNYENSKIIYNKTHLNDLIQKHKFTNIGLTSGCFDIIHSGHINNLKLCKNNCDKFFVCLSSDKQIKTLKGSERPINNLKDRIKLLSTLPFVDYIILYNEIDNETEIELDNIMNILKPNFWFKGNDYTIEKIKQKHPGLNNIILFDNIENKSTTNIIKKIQNKE